MSRKKYIFFASISAVAMVLGIFASLHLFVNQNKAYAASVSSCASSSGAGSVATVQNACQLCSSGGGGARGVMWFNDGSKKDSDVVVVKDSNAETVQIALWGQVYSCQTSGTGENRAKYIWVADAGQMKGSNKDLPNKVDFLSKNDAEMDLYRGSGQGAMYTWYYPMDNRVDLTLDIKKFKKYAEEKGSKTEADGKITYTAEVSVNRCFCNPKNGTCPTHYENSTNERTGSCYGDPSTIKLQIEGGSAESSFEAFSKLNTLAGGEKTSSADGDVESEITVSDEKAVVNFRHQLGYKPIEREGDFGEASTDWTVEVTLNGKDITNDSIVKYERGAGTYGAVDGKSRSEQSSSTSGKIVVGKGNDGKEEIWTPFVASSTVTVDVPETGDMRVCSKIKYNPKKIGWKQNESSKKYEQDASTSSGSEDSQACVTIKRGEETEGDGGQVRFWSQSVVTALNTEGEYNSAPSNKTDENKDNDVANIYYSTLKEKASVKFNHVLKYIHEGRGGKGTLPPEGTEKDEYPEDVCTEVTITRDGKDIKKENVCANSGGIKSGTEAQAGAWENIVNDITLKVGEEVTVCEKIYYKPKTVFLKRVEVKVPKTTYVPVTKYDGQAVYTPSGTLYAPAFSEWTRHYEVFNNMGRLVATRDTLEKIPDAWGGPVFYDSYGRDVQLYEAKTEMVFDHWKYLKDGDAGDDGSSEVCAHILRVSKTVPQDPPSSWTNKEGGASTDPMYAGEESKIGWDRMAEWYDTHQLIEWRATAFQVKVGHDYHEGALHLRGWSERNTFKDSPLTWYKNQFGGDIRDSKETVKSDDRFVVTGPKMTYGLNKDSIPVIAPNEVGDKYCTASGFHWQYKFGVSKGKGVRPTEWEDGQTYWTVYDAACSPIAKKPSVSIINSGIGTAGGVKGAVATRYNDFSFGQEVGGTATMFGSWTEHLAAIGGSVSYFSSGATLAWKGEGGNSFNSIENSPMTIHNATDDKDEIGKSGILANSMIRTRLAEYFGNENSADVVISGDTTLGVGMIPGSSEAWDNVTSSHIIYVNGKVTIDDDIKLSNANAATIQSLPQVVIYATKGIKVSPKVKQIDAWLITASPDATVETCSDWSNGITQAKVSEHTTGADCFNRLTINGPIFTNKLITTRSAGATMGLSAVAEDKDGVNTSDDRAASGEILNLSAENYLWAYAQAGRYTSSYTEAYSRELPPRY